MNESSIIAKQIQLAQIVVQYIKTFSALIALCLYGFYEEQISREI